MFCTFNAAKGMSANMRDLEEKLGYSFCDKGLLKTALTHSSYANEMKREGVQSNERLEFLGDSILGMLVAKHIYEAYPSMQEGKMTRLRSELVCEQALSLVAEKLSLGEYLYLGKGELQGGGRKRPSLLADAVEAILAAVSLDGGLMPVRKIVNEFILSNIEEVTERNRDYKTCLQEEIQKKSGRTFLYNLIEEKGPDHQKEFTVEVLIDGQRAGLGQGKTKKEAEQVAAAVALECMSSWDV